MNDLIIQKTPSTPEVEFKSSGHLSIKGKSLPEDPAKFYTPLFKWLDELTAEQVKIDVKLDYVNTSSSKRIGELIKALDTNHNLKRIELNWFYEADDPDMLEFGQMIEHNLRRTKSNYIAYEDTDEQFV